MKRAWIVGLALGLSLMGCSSLNTLTTPSALGPIHVVYAPQENLEDFAQSLQAQFSRFGLEDSAQASTTLTLEHLELERVLQGQMLSEVSREQLTLTLKARLNNEQHAWPISFTLTTPLTIYHQSVYSSDLEIARARRDLFKRAASVLLARCYHLMEHHEN